MDDKKNLLASSVVVPLLGRSGRPNRPQLLLPRAGRSDQCGQIAFSTNFALLNLLDRPTKELYRRISADYSLSQ